MGCRYTRTLLEEIREHTDNSEYTVSGGVFSEGLSHNLLLKYINEGQELLQGEIILVYPDEFTDEEIIAMAGVEAYSIADNVFLNNKLLNVEYSSSGQDRDYIPLPQRTLRDRVTFTSTNPSFYIRRNGQLLFNPIPTNTRGRARVTFYRALDRLDIRRGKISSKTATTIVLADDTDLDNAKLGSAQYICIVSALGVVKDYNVLVSSYDSVTRTITIPSQTLVGAANDYVVVEQYTTTHSTLPINCEKFITTYCQLRTFNKDSSEDSIQETGILKDLRNEIINNYSEMSQDVQEIPELDHFIMT
jgi:hypothetical protein